MSQIDDILRVIEGEEQRQILPQMPGDEKVVPDVFSPVLPQPSGISWIGE
jgi:hypothetical protein